MSFLSIAGVVYQVLVDENPSQSFEQIGSRNRAFSAALHVQMIAQPRTWTFGLAQLLPTAFDTLLANTALGAFVACVGDFNNGVSVQCIVDVTDTKYYKPRGGTATALYRMPIVTLTETL